MRADDEPVALQQLAPAARAAKVSQQAMPPETKPCERHGSDSADEGDRRAEEQLGGNTLNPQREHQIREDQVSNHRDNDQGQSHPETESLFHLAASCEKVEVRRSPQVDTHGNGWPAGFHSREWIAESGTAAGRAIACQSHASRQRIAAGRAGGAGRQRVSHQQIRDPPANDASEHQADVGDCGQQDRGNHRGQDRSSSRPLSPGDGQKSETAESPDQCGDIPTLRSQST